MKSAIKIIGNIMVILFSPIYPALFELPRIINALQTGFYSRGEEDYYPDYPVSNITEILELAYPNFGDTMIISICISALVILPFAIYKEKKYENAIILSFLKKVIYLALPLYIPCLYLLLYIIAAPRIIIIYFTLIPISYSLFLNILLYLFVDIWTEKIIKK